MTPLKHLYLTKNGLYFHLLLSKFNVANFSKISSSPCLGGVEGPRRAGRIKYQSRLLQAIDHVMVAGVQVMLLDEKEKIVEKG